MGIRDRLVAIVLAAGLLLGMAGWQAVSPWLGLAVAVVAVFVACAVYRVDGAARPPSAPAQDPDRGDGEAEPVSRRRRAGGRP